MWLWTKPTACPNGVRISAPCYLKIAEFISRLPYRPVIGAFTATATEQVKQDIIALLQLNQPFTLTTGFDRPNLYFGVARPRDKERYIEEYILDHRDRSGIVYCATRKSVESVCKELRSVGISATRYHAGLTPEERSKNQEDFVYDRKRVMVATNAFGMGIDKSNVSFVLHYNMPKNLENYYQEAGRAGRDGERAECILLFSLGDVQTAKYFIQNSHDNDELTPEQAEAAARRDRERLDVMVGYCKTPAACAAICWIISASTTPAAAATVPTAPASLCRPTSPPKHRRSFPVWRAFKSVGPAGWGLWRWCRCCAAPRIRKPWSAGWTSSRPMASCGMCHLSACAFTWMHCRSRATWPKPAMSSRSSP